MRRCVLGGGHKVVLISFYSHVDPDSDTRTHASINKSTVLTHIERTQPCAFKEFSSFMQKRTYGIPGKKKWTVQGHL